MQSRGEVVKLASKDLSGVMRNDLSVQIALNLALSANTHDRNTQRLRNMSRPTMVHSPLGLHQQLKITPCLQPAKVLQARPLLQVRVYLLALILIHSRCFP